MANCRFLIGILSVGCCLSFSQTVATADQFSTAFPEQTPRAVIDRQSVGQDRLVYPICSELSFDHVSWPKAITDPVFGIENTQNTDHQHGSRDNLGSEVTGNIADSGSSAEAHEFLDRIWSWLPVGEVSDPHQNGAKKSAEKLSGEVVRD